MSGPGTLHMLCGKIASGKSTLARRLADETGATLLSQDHFLSRLYPQEIRDVADFTRWFSPPSEAEGFVVRCYRGAS